MLVMIRLIILEHEARIPVVASCSFIKLNRGITKNAATVEATKIILVNNI